MNIKDEIIKLASEENIEHDKFYKVINDIKEGLKGIPFKFQQFNNESAQFYINLYTNPPTGIAIRIVKNGNYVYFNYKNVDCRYFLKNFEKNLILFIKKHKLATLLKQVIENYNERQLVNFTRINENE